MARLAAMNAIADHIKDYDDCITYLRYVFDANKPLASLMALEDVGHAILRFTDTTKPGSVTQLRLETQMSTLVGTLHNPPTAR
jgi:hypothetical protein